MEEPEGKPSPEHRRVVTRRRSRQVRRGWIWVALVAGILGAALTVVLFRAPGSGPVPRIQLPGSPPEAHEVVTLYFADPRWTQLVPEQREIPPQSEAMGKIRVLLEALVAGPVGDAAPVLPKETRLRNLYLGKDGLVVIDFEPDAGELGAGGVSGEILAVFSLVHTLVQNVPGTQSVRILVGGQERETLAGHVKISEALQPDPRWVSGK